MVMIIGPWECYCIHLHKNANGTGMTTIYFTNVTDGERPKAFAGIPVCLSGKESPVGELPSLHFDFRT